MKLRNFLAEGALNTKTLCISFSSDGKQSELSKTLKNVSFVGWDDLAIESGEILAKGEKLSSFKFIIVGAVGKNVALNSCVQEAAKASGTKVFNYGTPTELNNKILQTVKMKQSGVEQIKTIICQPKTTSAASLVRELKLPVVSKIIDGSQGKGVEKHDTKEDLEKFLKKNKDEFFIFQEFVPNDGDYRIFYVKSRVIYTISRKSQKESEFRNNISLGGKQENVELPPEGKKVAEAARACMGFDVTGVDLIQHKKTKKWYVMEINAAPQFWGPSELPQVIDAIIDQIN